MKIRNGFVSNSSSASFIIKKKNLTEDQINKIKNYYDEAKKLNKKDKKKVDFEWIDKFWMITEEKKYLKGFTSMANFNMLNFLEVIGVEREYIDYIDIH